MNKNENYSLIKRKFQLQIFFHKSCDLPKWPFWWDLWERESQKGSFKLLV